MTQDEGYSNYTVLDTVVHCVKNSNQYFPCSESYSWLKPDSPDYEQLKVAENCKDFSEGEGMQFDVDGEITIDDCKDQDLKQAIEEYLGKQ